jgi:hypothetical protein
MADGIVWAQLNKVSQQFTQKPVFDLLRGRHLQKLPDLLAKAQPDDTMNVNSVVSIAFAMTVIGGASFDSVPSFLGAVNGKMKGAVLDLCRLSLGFLYKDNRLSEWIVSNY